MNHKICLVKEQDHLGKHKAKYEAPGRPDATSWTTESQAYLSQRFKSRMIKKRQTVAKLIEKFESHKYKEQFLQDMSQTQKINRFSAASQKLPKDLNQTEIFELEVGIIYCRCGRNLKHNRSPKPNLDCNSIGGYIKRKNCSRGPKRGPTKRQEQFFKAKDMLQEAKKRGFPTILARWQDKKAT